MKPEQPMTPNDDTGKQGILNALAHADLLVDFADHGVCTVEVSEERRIELARLFGKSGPLSTLILEERGEG